MNQNDPILPLLTSLLGQSAQPTDLTMRPLYIYHVWGVILFGLGSGFSKVTEAKRAGAPK